MDQRVKRLIDQGTQARLRRNWRTVARVCRQLREVQLRSGLGPAARAQLEILEHNGRQFEHDRGDRWARLQSIASQMAPAERNQSFLLLYELSGCLIHSRDYSSALQLSQQAEAASFDFNSWLSAHLNSLVCREAIGLDIGADLLRVEKRLAELGRKSRRLNPKAWNEVALMRLRHHFRHGRVELIEGQPPGKLLYYWWLRSLPQLPWRSKAPKMKAPSMPTAESYHHFVLNTLLFRCEQADLLEPPMNHWCDRLYLWAWTWYLAPERVPLTHLWWLLEGFEFERGIEQMTMEDRMMVYHSLSLVTAQVPKAQSSLKLLASRLGPLEYGTFPYLAQELKRIEAIRKKERSQPRSSQFKITVSLSHARVDGPRGAWSVLSEPLSRALVLLLSEQNIGSVSLDRFVQEVFGLPVFDSLIHYRKVFNLLSRMKSLVGGEVSFQIRNPHLHFEINPRKYRILDEGAREGWDVHRWQRLADRIGRNLSALADRSSTTNQTVPIKTLFLLKPWCSRAEIERARGWNKSTATRRLRDLVASGTLIKKGQGRSVRYAWVSQN